MKLPIQLKQKIEKWNFLTGVPAVMNKDIAYKYIGENLNSGLMSWLVNMPITFVNSNEMSWYTDGYTMYITNPLTDGDYLKDKFDLSDEDVPYFFYFLYYYISIHEATHIKLFENFRGIDYIIQCGGESPDLSLKFHRQKEDILKRNLHYDKSLHMFCANIVEDVLIEFVYYKYTQKGKGFVKYILNNTDLFFTPEFFDKAGYEGASLLHLVRNPNRDLKIYVDEEYHRAFDYLQNIKFFRSASNNDITTSVINLYEILLRSNNDEDYSKFNSEIFIGCDLDDNLELSELDIDKDFEEIKDNNVTVTDKGNAKKTNSAVIDLSKQKKPSEKYEILNFQYLEEYISQFYTRSVKNIDDLDYLRRGRLNNREAKKIITNQAIFKEINNPLKAKDRPQVVVLLDMSSSMQGLRLQKGISYLHYLHKGFSKNGIYHKMIGYTTLYLYEILSYKLGNTTGNNIQKLFECELSTTNDSEGIELARKSFNNKIPNKKIICIISDGEPNYTQYKNLSATEAVKYEIDLCESQGIEFAAFAIDKGVERSLISTYGKERVYSLHKGQFEMIRFLKDMTK